MRCAEELSARIRPEHSPAVRPFWIGMGGRISQSVKSSQDAAVSTAMLCSSAPFPETGIAEAKCAELSAVASRAVVIILHIANELRKVKEEGTIDNTQRTTHGLKRNAS